jgi:hypothetical protein
MTKTARKRASAAPAAPSKAATFDNPTNVEAERLLARRLALGVPLVTLLAAIGVGMFASVAPALLVATGGLLFGVVVLFWTSLRTLSGEIPLDAEMARLEGRVHNIDLLAEQKQSVLRALKDMENERALGKMDEADFAEVAERYRREAKHVMRQMDEAVAPLRARAEAIARGHLEKKGLVPPSNPASPASPPATPAAAKPEAPGDRSRADELEDLDSMSTSVTAAATPHAKASSMAGSERRVCLSCTASNEADAALQGVRFFSSPIGAGQCPVEVTVWCCRAHPF